MTAATPGTLSASLASIPLIVAWAYGLRTMSSQSMPGRTRSSMYSPAPRMNRGSSLRLTEWPIPPTSGVVVVMTSAISCLRHGSRDDRRRLGRRQLACRLLDRLDDVDVTGAATEVPADPLPDLLVARVGVLAEEPSGLHDHARRAEPALQAVLIPERLLERVEVRAVGHPLDGADLGAARRHGEHRAGLGAAAVDQHRACPAVAGVAADVGPGQAERVAQEMDEQKAGLDLCLAGLAVHGESDVLSAHGLRSSSSACRAR